MPAWRDAPTPIGCTMAASLGADDVGISALKLRCPTDGR
jgi:hypothetical protein